MNWQKFPKTELHLHLEGAAPPDFVVKKAHEKSVDISVAFDGENYLWNDFRGFLATYEEVMRVLKTPEDFYELTKTVLAEQAKHGVVYTEIFLGSVLMCDNDAVLWAEMMAAIEAASDEMEPEIIARFIAVAVRHFGVESGVETAELVAKHSSPRLTGFGMAGAEEYLRAQDFVGAFRLAKEAGFGLTCHAGEWGAPETIEETIEHLSVSRLGHGVRASECEALLKRLKDSDIHCEVCPGSNIALGAYPDWPSHPITKMRDSGISLSISSDDPPHFKTNMTNEYEQLAALGWRASDFARSNRQAMQHAFCDENTRKDRLKNWSEYADHL